KSEVRSQNEKTLGDRGSDMVRKNVEEEAAATWPIAEEKLQRKLLVPSQGRMYYIRYAFKMGWTVQQVFGLTKIDPWFLTQMKELVDFEEALVVAGNAMNKPDPSIQIIVTAIEPPGGSPFNNLLRRAKEWGYSDIQLATVLGVTTKLMRGMREMAMLK